ncbi:hypothetical protein JCM3765_004709 [Sporobolomyces pararoseus]
MNCFICSEYLNGDDQFIQSHLNRCLDRQGSSSTSSSQANPSPSFPSYTASSLKPLATSYSTDEALALSLATQEQQTPTKSSGNEGFDELLCPCCQVLWEDINLTFSRGSGDTERRMIEEKRRKHVMKCLEARGNFNNFEQGEEDDDIQHGSYEEDDGQGDGEETMSDIAKGKQSGKGWNGGVGTKGEVKGTRGLIPLIKKALVKSHSSPHGKTLCAYLTSDQVEHIGTKFGDWGWGCGYKNLQMVLSSARHLPQYQQLFSALTNIASPTLPLRDQSDTESSNVGAEVLFPIPTILELQGIIQTAWSLGYDPPGALHFNHRLIGSKKWIGTTEVFTALSYLGIRAKIVDFPKVKKGELKGGSGSGDGTHQTLIKWIISYFSTPPNASQQLLSQSVTSSYEPRNAFTTLLSSSQRSSSIQTVSAFKQPLYLQHSGHSRTIVGVERMKNSSGSGGEGEEWLLIFDPGKPISNELKRLSNPALSSTDSGPLAKKFKPNGFGTSSSSSAKNASGDQDFKFGDVLKVFRVNMKDLKKKDEYQILYVEDEGLPLSEREKERRKTVMADIGKSVWTPPAPSSSAASTSASSNRSTMASTMGAVDTHRA